MKKITKLAFSMGSILCFHYINTYSEVLPNRDDPSTFLGPSIKGSYSSFLTDNTAYSLLGEVGFKNARMNGTLGWRFSFNQHLKISAEYLWQQITYAFFTDNSDQWVTQGSIGAIYQYDFIACRFDPSFDLTFSYSHAPSKSLNIRSGTYVNSLGNTRAYLNERRIAGSNSGELAPGLSFSPWLNGRMGLELNYDHTDYDKKHSPNQHAEGFGGTIRLDQALTYYLFFTTSAAIRAPFNNYTASIAWTSVPYYGGIWKFGFNGAYTVGKNTLPNTWNVGLTADYLIGPCPVPAPFNFKGDYKGEAPLFTPPDDGLLIWSTKPAVFMPQVLTIVDERVKTRAFI